MMKGRIHNGNVDVVIEGKDRTEILDKFQKQYPEVINNTKFVEWENNAPKEN
jgi:hypothetical protein